MQESREPEVDEKEDGLDRMKELLDEERKRSEGYLTRLKYLQADFENFRKRSEKEMKDVEDSSLRGLVANLIGTLDELELAVENAGEERRGELQDGLKMIRKNLASALEAAGLSRIECVGKPFDPSLHEAVEKIQGSTGAEDTVIQEVRPGYSFRGRVVRPSMVKVELAQQAPGEEEEEESE